MGRNPPGPLRQRKCSLVRFLKGLGPEAGQGLKFCLSTRLLSGGRLGARHAVALPFGEFGCTRLCPGVKPTQQESLRLRSLLFRSPPSPTSSVTPTPQQPGLSIWQQRLGADRRDLGSTGNWEMPFSLSEEPQAQVRRWREPGLLTVCQGSPHPALHRADLRPLSQRKDPSSCP